MRGSGAGAVLEAVLGLESGVETVQKQCKSGRSDHDLATLRRSSGLGTRLPRAQTPPQLMAFSRHILICSIVGTLAAVLCFSQLALAAGGGSAPSSQTVADPGKSGGAGTAKKKKKAKKRVPRNPVIAGFTLSGGGLTNNNVINLRYRITAPSRKVRIRAVVRTEGGRYVKTLELGVQKTNVLVKHELSAQQLGVKRGGDYKLRITARDGKNRAAKRAKKVPAWREFRFSSSDYRFPVNGKFSFGGDGARFGAGRSGHSHQGQDVIADSGTELVAPYAGKVTQVAYQAGGAGYYVVMSADDSRDYVFMHMLKGSTAVKLGDRVTPGQAIGLVGSTGASSGPHLHFEVWTGGPWQFGGKPIDPLSLLKSWYEGDDAKAARISRSASAAAASSRPLHPPHPDPIP